MYEDVLDELDRLLALGYTKEDYCVRECLDYLDAHL